MEITAVKATEKITQFAKEQKNIPETSEVLPQNLSERMGEAICRGESMVLTLAAIVGLGALWVYKKGLIAIE